MTIATSAPLRRILCPVDFSAASAKALAYAATLARWHDAEVAVLHVHEMPLSPLFAVGPYLGAATPVVLSSADRAQMEDALVRFAASEATHGVTVRTTLLEDVNASAAILSHVQSARPDLVVMGTEGHSGIERLLLGSVAERVLRRAPCPVLTVPAHARPGLSADGALEVLCPLDFSPSSTAALHWAAAWAAKAGAHLTVLHVIEMPPEAPDPPIAEYKALLERLTQDARRTMDAAIPAGLRQSGRFSEDVAVGRPGTEILRVADARRADLIVMGVRGRSAVDLAVFGSTAHQVVRHAVCPVLAVHPDSAQVPSARP
jgi:nucleotide-binding universal stress UspA family protein